MTYCRVIPRDLFNESKLLKCLGQLALHIHDGKAGRGVTLEHDGEPFEIEQNQDDGELFCANLTCRLKDGRKVGLSSSYNCKAPYPLCFNVEDERYGSVFNDDGSFSDEFLGLIE